jgi:DNA invertase Pin-like site-specific DNA recombinase
MIYGYIRVSTDKQTVENQRFEINNFCNRKQIAVQQWIEETISGTKEVEKRALGRLLKKLNKGDVLICSELSRLGRSLFMIMDVLSECMKKEIQLWTIKDNYRLGTDISSKVLAFAFGLSAEIERNLISQRTKEALARAKSEGIHIGRKIGVRNSELNKICTAKHNYIVNQLEKGISIPKIAKRIKVARGTLYRYLAYKDIWNPRKTTNGKWIRGIY